MNGESWKINPETRDYEIGADGKPVIDRTTLTPAYVRLITPRTQWLYAPDARYGSDFRLKIDRNGPAAAGNLEAMAERALQPMIEDGRATAVEVVVDEMTRNAAGMTARIQEVTGKVTELKLNPIR